MSAHYWFTEAAQLGLAPAQFNLATFFEDGLGCIEDLDKAFTLYEKAAQSGFVKAWHNLAVMHYSGKGTDKDLIKAYAWTLLAAKAQVKEAVEAEPVLTSELETEALIAGKQLLEELEVKYRTYLA